MIGQRKGAGYDGSITLDRTRKNRLTLKKIVDIYVRLFVGCNYFDKLGGNLFVYLEDNVYGVVFDLESVADAGHQICVNILTIEYDQLIVIFI